MKNTFLLALLGILLWCGCKKVDDHAALVANQPWLSDSYTQQTGTHLAPVNWTYPTAWVVGDTAMLIGNLFPYSSTITVGNVPIKIVDTAILTPNYTTYSSQPQIQAVRFVVTADMGIGSNRQVSVTANGVTIYGAPVSIRLVNAGSSRTDTTLWVDQIASWVPDNLNDYTTNKYNMVRSIHNDRSGNIYFDNQLSVQMLSNGITSTILKKNDVLRDDKGNDFTVKNVLGSTVSFSGQTLYFSLETNENTPDVAQSYVFRLCKMDIASKNITTLNRTLVNQQVTANETQVPIQGDISHLKLVAMLLNIDYNDNLFFTNYYSPGKAGNNQSIWYRYVGGNAAGGWSGEPIGGYVLISKMDVSGQVRGLMSSSRSYPAPGIRIFSGNYLLDPDGKNLYGFNTTNYIAYDMIQYNLVDDEQGVTINPRQTAFNFQSFETDPAYKQTTPSGLLFINPYNRLLRSVIQLANGNTLQVSNRSLKSYDIANLAYYTYAGTEIGMNQDIEQQVNLTGLAKWVDFSKATLIGQDKNGVLYFMRDGNTTTPPIFYKLYPKKS
ncbi:hypothetical protein HHL17_06865 [Chitinophaga sp. G-6-1-13]|uniref:Uncharacterized protein n=1 Tax=Chitinophaga fulva TaxID=2728842 RepID=A0A848GE25_9BACT|nr:hypothetical protein [Chitinophaga fulva]NML36915.1 hypothetical protein [Chitinophaga fulva]